MANINKVKVDKLIRKLGQKYNLPHEQIREIVFSQFEFTAEKLKEYNFGTLQDIEELEPMKTTFLFKSLGRLYISPLAVQNLLNRIKRKKRNGRSK